MALLRVGVDVGGTFTDAVLWDDEKGLVGSVKVPSSTTDPAGAVLAAMAQVTADVDQSIGELVHGTTIGTNVALEGSGPRAALITTEGFRDVLEIGRLTRPADALYDLLDPGDSPLIARRDRFEVAGRVEHDGTVSRELDTAAVEFAARAIAERGITSVAVSILHAHLNPELERRAAEVIARTAPHLSVSLSSDILPEIREFERTAAAVLNAYLVPACGPYLSGLTDRVDQYQRGVRKWIMQSNGGVTSPGHAASTPVNLLMSGPSGGVVAAQEVARQTGLTDMLTIDMGGTSFDVCLLSDAEVPLTNTSVSLGLPVRTPTVDIATIGTGGGSIAWVDSGGQFLVGPRSAGASPGPACYGLGGQEPTVTDANVVLGLLPDGTQLGQNVVIDSLAAHRACQRLGDRLGLDPVETALGIRKISNTSMAGAVRTVSVGRGLDPRLFALSAFGGAGPMHAADIAAEIAVPTLVVPPVAGALSALGLVVSDVVHSQSCGLMQPLNRGSETDFEHAYAGLMRRCHEQLSADGVCEDAQNIELSLELHYSGQNSTIVVPMPATTSPGWSTIVRGRFDKKHEQLNGFMVEDEPVHVAVLRATGVGQKILVDLQAAKPRPTGSRARAVGTRDLLLNGGQPTSVPLFERALLEPGHTIEGAAVIDSDDTSIVVPPRAAARVDGYGNIRIDLKGSK